MYIEIPTYDLELKQWSTREFETKDDFHKLILNQFKVPGEYNLTYTEGYWNNEGRFFDKNGYYCRAVKNSRDFIKHWDAEKDKCNLYGGVIYYHKGEGLEYFVPGPYYFYINYCPIYEKIKKIEQFPDIWDSDYHFFLYIALCILEGKHSVVLKKRQSGYSFKHAALLVLNTWFRKRQVNKIFAFKNDYVDATWNFVAQFRNHINRFTGWYRNFSPDKTLDWQQKIEVIENSKKVWKGSFNILKGYTTKDDAAKIVGGGNSFVYGEEAGINPNLGKTHEYLLPAVKLGHLTTGLIMYSGSVGELDDCEPLKEFFYKPGAYGFRPVENIWDDDSKGNDCGFFVPEYWNYPECMDYWGNSDVKKAKEICDSERKDAERKGPEQYRLYISQAPFTPSEAFATRTESKFPLHLLEAEMLHIKLDNKFGTVVDLDYTESGKVIHTLHTRARPIMDFPVKQTGDKEGATVIYDFPEPNPPFGLYFAGVDPVRDIKTDYSVSLASCFIVKRSVEKNGFLEPERVVACYTGRYDDSEKTHDTMCKLIEFYNARALVENDVDTFIRYMMLYKKQKNLISKKELALLHDFDLNVKTHSIYGITGTLAVSNRLMQSIIDFLKEEFHKVYDDKTGAPVKTIRGVNYLRDFMLLNEMKHWKPGLNVDRIKAFGYALMASQAHSTHYQYKQRTEEEELEYVRINEEVNQSFIKSPFTRFRMLNPFNKLK